MLNVTFCFPSFDPTKREVNSSNYTFLEADIVRNFGVLCKGLLLLNEYEDPFLFYSLGSLH